MIVFRFLSFVPLLLSTLAVAADSPPQKGLLLWLDTADEHALALKEGFVASWMNKAPAGGALIADGKQRPKWVARTAARPGVLFDGINDALAHIAFDQRAKTWTLLVVATPYGPTAEGGAFCSARSRDGHDYDPGFTVDTYQSSPERFDQISVEGAGRIGGQQDQMEDDFAWHTPRLIVVERDAEEIRIFVDGEVEGKRPVSPATTIMDEFRLGARHYGERERAYFKGELHTVLLYNRILSPEERGTLERQYFITSAEREVVARETEAPEIPKGPRMTAPVVVKAWPDLATFWAERPEGPLRDYASPGKLPIRKDLKEAIALSMGHLVSLFDADKDMEPYFYSNHRVDGTGEMHHSVNIGIPHVTGRCLLGVVFANQATGLPIDPAGLEVLRRYAKVSFDNPYDMNAYVDPEKNNEKFVEFHNVREGLFSLWALIVHDRDPWALEMANKVIAMLQRITDERGVWSNALIDKTPMAGHYGGAGIPNLARAVEPLLALYSVTDNKAALELAGQYARAGIGELYQADGHFTEWTRSSGHVHSITSALSGITDYAVSGFHMDMEAQCRRVMEVGVPEYHSSWGWGDEVFPEHPANEVGRGEINQTGDVVRTALLLGAAGHPQYYAQAERYLRGMLLPTQHREPELRAFMRDNEKPKNDSEFDVVRRTVGGYAMQLPNDRMREGDWPLSTLDITSGAIHAMAECYRHRVTQYDETIKVNLHLDYDGDAVTIKSSLPLEGKISFAMKKAGVLRIRVPEWCEGAAMQAEVNGAGVAGEVEEGYFVLAGLAAGARGEVTFPVACKVEKETVDGTEYTTTWIGNQIVDIEPRGVVSPLPF
jgi:hypothetical protein